jgi:alkyl sulfatase BDS1-like metallo-beta-lactamase superfamily hydrolase
VQLTISENVFAGNAMTRRTQYQYAVLLARSPFGHVDQSIGKNVAIGNVGLIAPTRLITKDFEELTIDGVKMVFQNTPDTEAPVEMNTYFPQFKAFWGSGEYHRHNSQYLHPTRRTGAQCVELVEADQRRALEVRSGSRSDVRVA